MSYDDEHLGELLRMLAPAPAHLVATAKELVAHFSEQPEASADDQDSDVSEHLPAGHGGPGYEAEHDSFQPLDDDPGPDGADWL